MYNPLQRYLPLVAIIYLCVVQATPAFAINNWGESSQAVVEIEIMLTNLVSLASFILGFCFVVSSFTKYKTHYNNPSAMPLSTPVTLMMFGLLLVGISIFTVMGAEALFGNTLTDQQLISKMLHAAVAKG